MDFSHIMRMGEVALGLTNQAMRVIQNKQSTGETGSTMVPNPYVRGGFSPVTPADLPAQRIYTDALSQLDPESVVIAEEKDPERLKPTWVVDGLDGSSNFSRHEQFGYGTQCALLLPDGTVPIAFIGDATTSDIFGYYGNSGVFHIDGATGERSYVNNVVRSQSLQQLVALRRPSLDLYHPLSQRLLTSGLIGTPLELLGGIGTTMMWLLTDQIGVFSLRPHHERPWDAIPAYALCQQAGMVFMTPNSSGGGFQQWQPTHLPETWMRDFDLFVLHHSRVPEFQLAVASL